MWTGNKKILLKVFSIQKITDMLSSNYLLSLYTKGMLHQGLKIKKLNNFSNFKSVVNRLCRNSLQVKSVQSALSDLLNTSATHGTFSRPSTKRGLILIGLELNTNARESFEHC